MSGIKVFLVEDEMVIRRGIKNSIDWEKEGYIFCGEASDGELAYPMIIKEKPDILILDEPMNGLDKNGVQEMRELFLQMKSEGKLILLTSHNREDIEVLCDEVYEMEDGILTKKQGAVG